MRIIPFSTFLFGSLFAFAAVSCQKQGEGNQDLPPTLGIVGGDTLDWGEVGSGKLESVLQLVNVGGGTLRITQVKPSCGCTTTAIDKEEVASGDTATIGVTMDVTGRQGDYIKHIAITTNDSSEATRRITLKAHVVQDLIADPGYLAIADLKPGEKGSASITLRNVSDKPITIQKPKEVGSTLMTVKFDMTGPTTLQPGDSLQVTATAVTLNPAPAPAQYIFATDSEMTPELKVRLNVHTIADATVDASGGTPPIGIPPGK